jgi:hypothetical protein
MNEKMERKLNGNPSKKFHMERTAIKQKEKHQLFFI